MTVAISKPQLNNFEEMLSTVQKSVDKNFADLNKSNTDFKKIFDKSVDKINNETTEIKSSENIQLSDTKEALKEELKTILQNEDSSETETKIIDFVNKYIINNKTNIDDENWAEFKEMLTNIINETSTELSLDLSLSKDIEEIITQLQEAITNAIELIENIENTETIIMTNADQNNLSNFVTDEEYNSTQTNLTNESYQTEQIDLNKQSNSTKDLDYTKQIDLTKQSNSTKKLDLTEQIDSTKQSILDKNENQLEPKTLDSNEIIEFSENITEEVATSTNTKTNETESTEDLESLLDEDIIKDLKIESVQAETDTTGNETFMQQQAPEEIAIKAIINKEVHAFDTKIEAVQNTQPTQQQSQAKPVDINPSRILEQISRQLEGLQNGSKVNLVLNPESLGKVNIQLLSTKEGLMAQFTVTTQEARDVLMKGLDGLKESLLAHGINADNVSVKVADSQKSEYNEEWTEQEGSRGGNKGQREPNKEEKEKGLFEQVMAQNLEQENGNV